MQNYASVEWLNEILACPYCKCSLSYIDGVYGCTHCSLNFETGPVGQPDLRLTGPIGTSLTARYDPSMTCIPDQLWSLPPAAVAKMYQAKNLLGRPQADIRALMLASINQGQIVLDLGSKSNRDQELVERLGARYVAVEIATSDAMILGDAHAIPLVDNSVDVVLCMSVLEHLKNPFLAVEEIYRVLRPGGRLIGIVGFLEPVHGLPHGSFFHHSYLGVYTLLSSMGFTVDYLAVPSGWSAIHAISRAMLPGVSKRLAYRVIWPLRAMQNVLWRIYGMRIGSVTQATQQRDRILSAAVHFAATTC